MDQLLFHPSVRLEVAESFAWYESKAKGLGDDFLSELEHAYQAILEFPAAWPMFSKSFHRYLLSRFPYAVIYRQHGGSIYVVAVMHQRKKPDYWIRRI